MSFSIEQPGDLAQLFKPLSEDVTNRRVRSARLVAQVSAGASVGFALFEGFDRLVSDLRERGQPTFLVAGDPLDDIGFRRREQTALALRQDLGGWGVTVSAEGAQTAGCGSVECRGQIERYRKPAFASRYGVAIDREVGMVLVAAAASWLSEDQTILGTRIRGGLQAGGTNSLFLDGALSWRPGDGWRFGAAWRHGVTRSSVVGLASPGVSFTTDAWAFDVTRQGVLSQGASLSLRVSQPLRVANDAGSGLPVEYSYEMRGQAHVATSVTLAPSGREIAGEINWRGPLLGGWASTGLFYRKNPGHFATVPDDLGAAVGWSAIF